jgi:hypothetical protein
MKTKYVSYLIEVLQSDDWYGVSEAVDMAKGKYALPRNWSEGFKLIRREWQKK